MTEIDINQSYMAAISDFRDGDMIIKTLDGHKISISMGPAQVVSLKVALDRYVAELEAKAIHAKAS